MQFNIWYSCSGIKDLLRASTKLTPVKLCFETEFCSCVCVRIGDGDGDGNIQWCFSQVKGAMDDDVAEGKSLSLFWAAVSNLHRLIATAFVEYYSNVFCADSIRLIWHNVSATVMTILMFWIVLHIIVVN